VNLSGIKGVIFDLDGTLVESRLDFPQMRTDIGCPPNEDILTFVAQMACKQMQDKANRRILRHELHDAMSAKWLFTGKQMVETVRKCGLPMAIVTRNCRAASNVKIANNNIPIDLVLTREDAPAKPDPTALLMIAEKWQLQPKDCLYVGDYIYDQLAAENAGMQWLLV
jgi:HAD superfamily hydrolase (TIGR01509 family)